MTQCPYFRIKRLLSFPRTEQYWSTLTIGTLSRRLPNRRPVPLASISRAVVGVNAVDFTRRVNKCMRPCYSAQALRRRPRASTIGIINRVREPQASSEQSRSVCGRVARRQIHRGGRRRRDNWRRPPLPSPEGDDRPDSVCDSQAAIFRLSKLLLVADLRVFPHRHAR